MVGPPADDGVAGLEGTLGDGTAESGRDTLPPSFGVGGLVLAGDAGTE